MAGAAIAVGPGAQLREGRYELERMLGYGGMASVWLAADRRLQRPVAIKVMAEGLAHDPDYVQRFRREARLAASLAHPNLVRIYDFDADADRPYLVMEYVAGANLAERLGAGDRVDPERLAHQLLSALDHIHAAGIVHRDVKPQNVLIAPDGYARLTDFGIARSRDATALTDTGRVPGTARYMAPELLRGEPAGIRTDLYSCGVVLAECLGSAGEAPRLEALVERLRADEPAHRPASASSALGILGAARRASEPTTEPVIVVAADGESESSGLGRTGRPAFVTGEQETDPEHEADRGPFGRSPQAHPRDRGPLSPKRPARSFRGVVLAALVATTAAVLAVIALEDSDPQGDAGSRSVAAGGSAAEDGAGGDRAVTGAAAAVPQPTGNDPALGAQLNDQGFALIQEGRPEAAIPVLRRAVEAFPAGTDDLNYAYALFNLGNALRLAGRPEEAIRVLEERLRIPNQTATVQQELAAAREQAGGD
jgi:eukaryotic-like serine/threonine-protein kinase